MFVARLAPYYALLAWLPGLRGIETQQANGLLRAVIGGPEDEQWRVDHRQQFSGQRRVGLD